MRVKSFDPNLTLGGNTEDYVRSVGVHASDLYGALYKKIDPKRFDKRDEAGKPLPMDMARVELGFTFEEILERELARRLLGTRPAEMRTRHTKHCPERKKRLAPGKLCLCGAGIYFSPDYLFEGIDGELILGEFKCTWMSIKDAPYDRKFDKWKCQMKLYCYWLGITRARLYGFFVNGDWKTYQPTLLAWEFEFTQRELELNYNMVMRNALKEGLLHHA